MHYTQFAIEKYKAITHPIILDVEKNRLTPIIGINECGKTTILQGIFAFDSANDIFAPTVRHLSDVNNLYDSKSGEAIVSATVSLSRDDIERILTKLVELYNKILAGQATDAQRNAAYASSASSGVEKFREFLVAIGNESKVKIQRNLTSKWYSIVDESLHDVDPHLSHDVALNIIQELPYILYFDDFKDSIENRIEIPSDATKATPWFQIIERLFRKADPELDVFSIPKKEERQRKGFLSKVKRLLNTTIVREWETFRLDSRDALEIDVQYEQVDGKDFIKLDLVEKDSQGEEHYFYIKDRSKGFYWFFNFVMKLEFNPKFTTTQKEQEAIYLLDEPGSYLHALAQERLCNKLSQLASTNVVIYCTHSHYLLNPQTIPLNCVRVADKDGDGKVMLKTLFDFEGSIVERRAAFQPIWDALNIRPGLFEVGEQKIVIVEGIYDYYSLMLFRNDGWMVLPSVGADSIKYFVSLLLAWNLDFRALWDNDEKGIERRNEAQDYFGEEIASIRFRTLPLRSQKQRKAIIQDFFSGEDLTMIRQALSLPTNTSFEKTLLNLYYHSERNKVVKRVSERTRTNFQNLFESLE